MIPTNKTELESRLPPIPDPRQSPNARNYEEGEEKEEETKRSQEFSCPNGQVVARRLILILSAQHRSFPSGCFVHYIDKSASTSLHQ
jgi:hypothetical protein